MKITTLKSSAPFCAMILIIGSMLPPAYPEAITNEKLQEMLGSRGLNHGQDQSQPSDATTIPTESQESSPLPVVQKAPPPVVECTEEDLVDMFNSSFFGNAFEVERLLNKGCNVNANYPEGKTLLIAAVSSGCESVVKVLLNHGVDVDQRDLNNRGAVNKTALGYAAMKGRINIANLLLNKGANPNIKDALGVTPLMAAIMDGYTEMVRLLIQRGADVNLIWGNGMRPLDLALGERKHEMIAMLREAGAIADPKVEERFENG